MLPAPIDPPLEPAATVVAREESIIPSESGAGAAAAGDAIIPTPFAALLAGHILRDGEVVILILRPSKWFIPLGCLKFLAVCAIMMILSVLFDERLRYSSRQFVTTGAFLIAARLMWGAMQWMGRLYILTDLRIIRLAGVFALEIFDCPLRKVARTILTATTKERVCRVGSIDVIPQDEEMPVGTWQMVADPRAVHRQILHTIRRARQGGHKLA